MTSPTHSALTFVAAACMAGASVAAVAHSAPADAVTALPLPVGGFHDGVYVPLDDVPIGESGVVANGNLALTWAGSQFEADLDENDELASSRSDVGLRGAATLELSASATGAFDDTLELVTLPLTPIEAGLLTITPYLGVEVRVAGRAEAGAQVSLVAPFDASAVLSSQGRRRDATGDAPPSFRPEIGLPDVASAAAFHATAELVVTTTFMIVVADVFPIGGPVLAASLGADVDVDLGSRPWWDLDAVAGLKYGWSMPDLTGAPQPAGLHSLFPPVRVDIASAQDGGPLPDVSTRWSRAVDSFNGDDAGEAVAIDNELVLAEQDGFPWFGRLSGLGNPSWQQVDDETMRAEGLAVTDLGDLVAAGVHGTGDARIERYDAGGTAEWAKVIDVSGVSAGQWTAVLPAADDGAVIAGNLTYSGGVRRAVLVELGPTGEQRWAKEIDPGLGATNTAIAAAARLPDGELLLVGAVNHADGDGTIAGRNALVLRLTADGDPLAAYALGGMLGEDANGIAVHDDGSYAISGQTAGAGDDHGPWVAAFGADDSLLWSSTYADRLDGGYASASGIAAVAGGGYVVSGWTGMTDEDSWLIRLDGSGMPIWSKTFSGADDSELVGVLAMPTGFAAYGQTNTTNPLGNSFDDLWVVRTNVDGMVHFDDDSGFDTINDAVQWHPSGLYTLHPLAPTSSVATPAVVDAASGATPAAATFFDLTG